MTFILLTDTRIGRCQRRAAYVPVFPLHARPQQSVKSRFEPLRLSPDHLTRRGYCHVEGDPHRHAPNR